MLAFEYYRAFPINEEQNKVHANVNLAMPVLEEESIVWVIRH